jgi:two-component system, cell cycle response regulator DivK
MTKKIVVVEDNAINMKLAVLILQKGGYEVLQATTGEAGILQVREQMPDLVVMDVQLPGMDGLTATRYIKSDPDLAHIPVLALTAHAMIEDKAIMLAAGCDSYMSKPLNNKEFLARVGQILEGTSAKSG